MKTRALDVVIIVLALVCLMAGATSCIRSQDRDNPLDQKAEVTQEAG